MGVAAGSIVAELRAETNSLDELVAELPEDGWARATPAAGWTIAHQIAHLLWTDRAASITVTDEPAFSDVLTAAAGNPTGFVDEGAEELVGMGPVRLLAEWRATRSCCTPNSKRCPRDASLSGSDRP